MAPKPKYHFYECAICHQKVQFKKVDLYCTICNRSLCHKCYHGGFCLDHFDKLNPYDQTQCLSLSKKIERYEIIFGTLGIILLIFFFEKELIFIYVPSSISEYLFIGIAVILPLLTLIAYFKFRHVKNTHTAFIQRLRRNFPVSSFDDTF